MDHTYSIKHQDRIILPGIPTAAVTANDDPPYFKLIADCWEHIFDYLSLKDVYSMGQSCNRMHRMAGYYFREYFSEIRFDFIRKRVRIHYLYDIRLRPDFYQYIGKLAISHPNKIDVYLDAKTFASLKSLQFFQAESIETQINYARDVLKNIKSIDFFCCEGIGKTFELVASRCLKLKKLYVHWCMKVRTRAEHAVLNTMLLQHYPKLEYFNFRLRDENVKINELKTFLEKHKQLKHFGCDHRFLWANRDLLNGMNVQLEVLTLTFRRKSNAIQFDQFVDFLKQLHERGFYKSLHIDVSFDDLNFNDVISKFDALQKVNTHSNDTVNFSRLINLKELSIFEIDDGDFEDVAKNLTKLERLRFQHASAHHVLPFIYYSKRLKTVQVYGQITDNQVLDLFELNEKRSKLENARLVTIHVDEKVYLREKWKSKNLNLSHVRIARLN